jgi:hypothetical protein
MSAFLSYDGAYEYDGRRYRWRCYATARVHGLRKREHGQNSEAPQGLKWIAIRTRFEGEPELDCLLDAETGDFSQMLVNVEAQAATPEREGELAAH